MPYSAGVRGLVATVRTDRVGSGRSIHVFDFSLGSSKEVESGKGDFFIPLSKAQADAIVRESGKLGGEYRATARVVSDIRERTLEWADMQATENGLTRKGIGSLIHLGIIAYLGRAVRFAWESSVSHPLSMPEARTVHLRKMGITPGNTLDFVAYYAAVSNRLLERSPSVSSSRVRSKRALEALRVELARRFENDKHGKEPLPCHWQVTGSQVDAEHPHTRTLSLRTARHDGRVVTADAHVDLGRKAHGPQVRLVFHH